MSERRATRGKKKDVVNKKARQTTSLFHVALIFVVVLVVDE